MTNDSTAPAEEVEPFPAEHTYIGRRTATNGKVVYAFMLGDQTYLYQKSLIPALKVGAVIRLNHTDGTLTKYWTGGSRGPTVIGVAEVPESTLLEWQAKDMAAFQMKCQQDATKRMLKNVNHLDRHIDALSDATKRMSAPECEAFIRYLGTRLR